MNVFDMEMATACEISSLTSKCKFKNNIYHENTATHTWNVKELQFKYTYNSLAQGVIDSI